MTPKDLIAHLALDPHPEGGWYRQTWIADQQGDTRAAGTAIYYLLDAGERSHWHRIDSAEIWHHYMGGAVRLLLSPTDGGPVTPHLLGPQIGNGQRPQVLVPPGCWQSAAPVDGWALMGCTVSPGFEFEHFEMAPKDWAPGGGD